MLKTNLKNEKKNLYIIIYLNYNMNNLNNLKTINEFIENNTIEKKNILSVLNFNVIFNYLKNSYENVFIIKPTLLTFEEDLNKIIEKANENKDSKHIILCQNIDVEMPPIKHKYLLMTNDEINKLEYDEIINKNIIDILPPNIVFIGYSISYTNFNKNYYMIPLGREINQLMLSHEYMGKTIEDRTILCYLNCGIITDNLWYGNIRNEIYEWAKTKSFITMENCENIKERKLNGSMYDNYYKKIGMAKFIICPRNKTIDTYRIWDAIYLGCIPIVIMYDGFRQFLDLPILFVNSLSELFSLTEESLNNIWYEYISNKWNYRKLDINFWMEYLNYIIKQ